MEISIVENRTPQVIGALLQLWEASVRVTHDFLTESEIVRIGAYVPEALQSVRHLAVAKREDGSLAAFLGVEGRQIEMLFVAPEERGKGTGRALIAFAAEQFSANEVTVNEQNALAVGFYEKMGFAAYRRTQTDEQGGPYPLLYMKR